MTKDHTADSKFANGLRVYMGLVKEDVGVGHVCIYEAEAVNDLSDDALCEPALIHVLLKMRHLC